jgi:hypothetical protein
MPAPGMLIVCRGMIERELSSSLSEAIGCEPFFISPIPDSTHRKTQNANPYTGQEPAGISREGPEGISYTPYNPIPHH